MRAGRIDAGNMYQPSGGPGASWTTADKDLARKITIASPVGIHTELVALGILTVFAPPPSRRKVITFRWGKTGSIRWEPCLQATISTDDTFMFLVKVKNNVYEQKMYQNTKIPRRRQLSQQASQCRNGGACVATPVPDHISGGRRAVSWWKMTLTLRQPKSFSQ